MRKTLPDKLEAGRLTSGPLASHAGMGVFGSFVIQGPCGAQLRIVSSGSWLERGDLDNWEHVSISTPKRCPNWIEMCFVKDLFWHEEETAIQFHPPRSEYVNNHPYCLHLWWPVDGHVRLPPPRNTKGIIGRTEAQRMLTVERAKNDGITAYKRGLLP